MKIIITKNKETNKVLPMVNLMEEEKEKELKKIVKKQIIEQIINQPESLKAYKQLVIYQTAIFEEDGKVTPIEQKKILDYEELFKELIEDLTKEKDEKW